MIKQHLKDKHMSEIICVDHSNLLYEADFSINFFLFLFVCWEIFYLSLLVSVWLLGK